MTSLLIGQQPAQRLNLARLIIDIRHFAPAAAHRVSVMPDDEHSRACDLAHHFSRFLSAQNTGACSVIPFSGTTTARACCGGS